ncbi:phage head closure protein [Hymenobacter aerilatus]|uniref:Phage head closure protein n=1 Tax=Hymenobacter aerilatus TaxID=2932251 RepID=A0A8T9T1W1_9BACT|nr:phage head closure protein [Hymenobacter aerilatus]UOR07164.1 phage head closure protein [Hymenobacter aerilatus]
MGRINAGDLNERVTKIGRPASVDDGRGGQKPVGPGVETQWWVKLRALRGSEAVRLGQPLGTTMYEVTARYEAHFTTKDRIRTQNGRTLNVVAVLPDGRKEYDVLTCIDSGQ